MKVLLIRPHITLKVARGLKSFLHLEPLALEIVAGGIDARHPTRILDLANESSPEAALRRTLRKFDPDVVGFTAFSNEAAVVKQLAAIVKAHRPDTFVLVGGVHATIAADDLNLPDRIDLVVRGEGATAMKTLLPLLEARLPLVESDVFLPTGSSRFSELAATPPPVLPTYEDVPAPRRELIDASKYYSVWHGRPGERLGALFPPTVAVRTSVGCPHRCSFCVVHHLARGRYMRRTPQDVVEELASLKQDHVYFVDDEMFIDAGRAEEIGKLLIARGVKKHYVSWARADTIVRHPEVFRLWKDAGLSLLYVGLESMEPQTLKDYNKGLSADVNRRAVEVLRELGIGLHAALMVNPDFTREDFIQLHKTIRAVEPAEVTFTVFSPPPGTPLWDKHRHQFICPDPYAFYDCMHTILPTRLPLKDFYREFGMLWLAAFRNNPWRRNKVKVPLAEFARFMLQGMRYGYYLCTIHRDYHNLRRRKSVQPHSVL